MTVAEESSSRGSDSRLYESGNLLAVCRSIYVVDDTRNIKYHLPSEEVLLTTFTISWSEEDGVTRKHDDLLAVGDRPSLWRSW